MSDTPEKPLDVLERRARRLRFFKLVSLLEREHARRVRIGGDGPPSSEGIRFRHDHSLGFSAGDVSGFSHDDQRDRTEVTTTFLGLTGSVSPLPAYVAESVLDEDDAVHRARRDFLDVFHHRALSLLYRSAARYSPSREHRTDDEDAWLQRVFAMAGLSYREPRALSKAQLLRLAPLLVRRARGALALKQAIRGALQGELGDACTIELRECAGGWVPVAPDERTALGVRNHGLGSGVMLGAHTYDQTGRFLIRITDVDRDTLPGFLEGGAALEKLRETVALILREPIEYDVELELAADAHDQFTLGRSRLGDTARLAGASSAKTIRTVRGSAEALAS